MLAIEVGDTGKWSHLQVASDRDDGNNTLLNRRCYMGCVNTDTADRITQIRELCRKPRPTRVFEVVDMHAPHR